MYQLDIEIIGSAPLLHHNFPLEALAGLQAGARRKSGAADYRMEWRTTMYEADGHLYHPAAHLEGAMVKAAGGFRIKGSKNRTYRDLFRAYIAVTPEQIPLRYDGVPIPTPGAELLTTPTRPLHVDIRRVVIARAAVARARLCVARGWSLRFTVACLDDQIRPEVVRTVLEDAGISSGIGDFRPKFGRFTIISWAERPPA